MTVRQEWAEVTVPAPTHPVFPTRNRHNLRSFQDIISQQGPAPDLQLKSTAFFTSNWTASIPQASALAGPAVCVWRRLSLPRDTTLPVPLTTRQWHSWWPVIDILASTANPGGLDLTHTCPSLGLGCCLVHQALGRGGGTGQAGDDL